MGEFRSKLARRWGWMVLPLGLVMGLEGCGYQLKTSRSALVEKENIHKVYVSPIVNNTYKAGVENIVYNALVKTLAAFGQVKLVQDPADADAILQGSVNGANTVQSLWKSVDQLNPVGLSKYDNIYVTTEYMTTLSCSFSLNRMTFPTAASKNKPVIWSGTFSREGPFTASNQLGPLGTTSTLINDSEFNRKIQDLARGMMGDVNESMLQMF